MASADVRKDLLECSVCLNIYTDPVILRCGHNFCRECIDGVLDTQVGSGVYSCPECRAESVERPALVRNITLCNIVDTFPSSHPIPETGIFCTYCVDGSPVSAVKSCLMCEASLCEKHLRVHSKSPEHLLTDPTASMVNKKCSIHNRILEYYCNQDAACICVSCSLAGDHRGHQLEMLKEASEKRKGKLRNNLKDIIMEREETEKKIQRLQEIMKEILQKSVSVKERVTALVRDLRRHLDDLEKRALCDISRQEDQMSQSLSDFIHELEIKKDGLSRKIHPIEELCDMTDPLTVLQASDTGDSPDTVKGHHEDGERCEKTPRDGGDLDVTVISQTLGILADIITDIKRGLYREGLIEILLDVNTANNNLHISDDRKTATRSGPCLESNVVERFQTYNNVLSSNSLSSWRHYWEAEWSEGAGWEIGMCYPSIERIGERSRLGNNDKSWCLVMCNNKYSVRYDNKETPLPHNVSSNRVRVSLDYEAGRLSFYELCDPIKHLHTFTTTFTQPLHAAICLNRKANYYGEYVRDWVKLLD